MLELQYCVHNACRLDSARNATQISCTGGPIGRPCCTVCAAQRALTSMRTRTTGQSRWKKPACLVERIPLLAKPPNALPPCQEALALALHSFLRERAKMSFPVCWSFPFSTAKCIS